jgi:hypothetical protein
MEEDEEKELEKCILQQCSWEKLPPHLKKFRLLENSKEVWKEYVVKYSVEHQLRWKTNLVRTMVPDEKTYYLQIAKISRMNLMVPLFITNNNFSIQSIPYLTHVLAAVPISHQRCVDKRIEDYSFQILCRDDARCYDEWFTL